jgi:hypothetical protein
MFDFCLVLIPLAIALFLWAAIGHVFWLIGAGIWKALFQQTTTSPHRCPKCQRPLSLVNGRCVACHAEASGSATHNASERTRLQHRLKQLHDQGQLTLSQYRELETLLSTVVAPPPTATTSVVSTNADIQFLEEHQPVQELEQVATPFAAHEQSDPIPEAVNIPEQLNAPPVRKNVPIEMAKVDQPILAEVLNPWNRPTPTPPPATKFSRTLAEMLQAFLEEKNIRWGEILAGLFIVVSAVGLIISLRNTLKAIPYFPALMFMLFTVLFHGAGLYSLRQWKLRAVSRVVLVISLLLVSLSFGAGIILSGSGEMRRPLGDPWVITAIIVSLATFSWVSWSSARELAAKNAWQLFLAVMGCAVGQIVINRWPLSQPGRASLWALALIPLASYLIPVVTLISRHARGRPLQHRRAMQCFQLGGIGFFSLLFPLALLIISRTDRREAWADLAPILSVAVGGCLGIALLLQRKLTSPTLTLWRTTATSMAILTSIALLALLILAWPRPGLLVTIGLLDAVAFIGLALLLDFPLLYIPGIAAMSVVVLIATPWLRGSWPSGDPVANSQVFLAISEMPGILLLAAWNSMVFALSVALRTTPIKHWLSAVHDRNASPRLDRVYLLSAGGVAATTVLLTINAGFAPWMPENHWPLTTSLLLAGYAVTTFVASRWVPLVALTYIAAIIGWLALHHGLVINSVIQQVLLPLNEYVNLSHAPTLCLALLAALLAGISQGKILTWEQQAFQRHSLSRRARYRLQPLLIVSVLASIIALILVWVPPTARYVQQASELGLLAITWLVLALVARSPTAITAAQLGCHATLAVALLSRWTNDATWTASYWPPTLVLEQCVGASLLATLWCVLRWTTERWSVPRYLLQPTWPNVDAILLPIIGFAYFAALMIGFVPALAVEVGWCRASAVKLSDDWLRLFFVTASWLAWGALLVGFVVRGCERFSGMRWLGSWFVCAVGVLLVAQAWNGDFAAASALRWGLALLSLVTTSMVVAREPLLAVIRKVPRWRTIQLSENEWGELRLGPLVVSLTAILLITCATVISALQSITCDGPVPGSQFDWLGMRVSYGVPLLAMVLSLGAFSLRERDSRFAAAAAAIFQLAVILALLLYLKDAAFNTSREALVLSLQVNALGSACFALLWLSLDPWIEPVAEVRHKVPRWIDYSVLFVTRLVVAMALWAVAAIVVSPATFSPWDARLADVSSFAALGLNVAIILWRYGLRMTGYTVQGVMLLLLSLSALVALAVDCQATAVPWSGYHFLEGSWLAIALLGTSLTWYVWWTQQRQNKEPLPHALAGTLPRRSLYVTLIAAGLAVWSCGRDPLHPWFACGILVLAQFAFVGQGLFLRTQWIAYAALVFAISLGITLWSAPPNAWWNTGNMLLFHGINFVGYSVAIVAGIWLAVEIALQRSRSETLDVHSSILPMHRFASGLLVLATLLVTCLTWIAAILFDWITLDLFELRIFSGLFVLSAGLLLAGHLWDRRASVLFSAYVWGAAATAFLVLAIHPPREWLGVSLLVGIATYVAITAHLWKWGADFACWGWKVGIPDPVAGLVHVARWLPAISMSAAGVLAVAALYGVLTLPQREMRTTMAVIPLLLAWTASSLAQSPRTARSLLTMYLFGTLAAICLGWADVAPDHSLLYILHLSIRLLMAFAFSAIMYGLIVPRVVFAVGEWNLAARRAAGISAVGALASLLLVLVLEGYLFQPGVGVPIDVAQIAAVSVMLVALVVGLLSLALLPGRDPLGMNEEGRMYYVYAAQAAATLLFAHLYMVRPGLFDDTLRPYWPYIIVVLAFASVGCSELFQRSGIRVLAQPLDRTGGVLPLLPALGMWFFASRTDYSLVLFAIGLVYLMQSWLRQSFISGLAALLAGNGALWAWLIRDEARSFFQHPQFWLIPPALSTLLAAHLQRRRLPSTTLTAIRYAATLVIYLSSTSEMFIVGIGNSLWPPMIVALLGLAGVFAGMLLQIRPFLYLGAGFILLALVSMVAHAARAIDHVWPWWAFGIGVGLAILIFFGIFEKQKEEVTKLIARLREWE